MSPTITIILICFILVCSVVQTFQFRVFTWDGRRQIWLTLRPFKWSFECLPDQWGFIFGPLEFGTKKMGPKAPDHSLLGALLALLFVSAVLMLGCQASNEISPSTASSTLDRTEEHPTKVTEEVWQIRLIPKGVTYGPSDSDSAPRSRR